MLTTRPKIDLIVRSLQSGQVVGLVSTDDQGGWTWRASRSVGVFLICWVPATADMTAPPRAGGHGTTLGRALAGLLS